jgi:hypothetical protein
MMMLHVSAEGLPVRVTSGRRSQELDAGIGECLGTISDGNRVTRQPLGSDSCRDTRERSGPGLQQFDPGASARSNRNDRSGAVPIGRGNILHAIAKLDAGTARRTLQTVVGISSDQQKRRCRTARFDPRPDRV